jgi:hypothetical protein
MNIYIRAFGLALECKASNADDEKWGGTAPELISLMRN